MRTYSSSNRAVADRAVSAFVGADSRTLEPRSIHLLNSSSRPGQHRNFVRSSRMPPTQWNEMAELRADIDGLPVLFRILVKDVPAKMLSDSVSKDAEIHSLLSSTLEKMVDRISSGEPLAEPHAPLNETVLRVGPLELDLLDRTAKRGDRQIDLRPREFRLLKYMMERSDKLLTRATLFKDVWHYKFIPETNLVDVHMGRLRRKVDGPNDAPMIRSVRGAGFALSATPLSQDSQTSSMLSSDKARPNWCRLRWRHLPSIPERSNSCRNRTQPACHGAANSSFRASK
jgi:DNA-binding winged helix-turn-helix (wHTH) protein